MTNPSDVGVSFNIWSTGVGVGAHLCLCDGLINEYFPGSVFICVVRGGHVFNIFKLDSVVSGGGIFKVLLDIISCPVF